MQHLLGLKALTKWRIFYLKKSSFVKRHAKGLGFVFGDGRANESPSLTNHIPSFIINKPKITHWSIYYL